MTLQLCDIHGAVLLIESDDDDEEATAIASSPPQPSSSVTSPPQPFHPQFGGIYDLGYYFYRHSLEQSPYYVAFPRLAVNLKAKQICKLILALPICARAKIELLVREFIRQHLPLTQLRISCWEGSHHDLFIHRFPVPADLARDYVRPLYQSALTKIRKAIANRQLFLSFTMHEFGLANELTGEKRRGEFMSSLFVIVGVYRPGLVEGRRVVDRKFVIKVARLLEREDDTLGDDVFRGKILWPNHDHLTQAARYLVHLFTPPELEMYNLARELQRTAFPNLVHHFYCGSVLHKIECDLRQKHSSVVSVIDTVRWHWNESPGFRDKYFYYARDHPPPESFYESADFYRDHFWIVQKEVLYWRSGKFRDVHSKLSDPEFKELLDDFVQHSALLKALARASESSDDWFGFSAQIGQILHEVIKVNQVVSTQAAAVGHRAMIFKQIGGDEAAQQIADSGDYKLLSELIRRLARSMELAVHIGTGEVTKWHLIKLVEKGHFCTANKTQQSEPSKWIRPLWTRQLHNCFPHFMSLFRQHRAPIPWNYMHECAVVYCFVEEVEEEASN